MYRPRKVKWRCLTVSIAKFDSIYFPLPQSPNNCWNDEPDDSSKQRKSHLVSLRILDHFIWFHSSNRYLIAFTNFPVRTIWNCLKPGLTHLALSYRKIKESNVSLTYESRISSIIQLMVKSNMFLELKSAVSLHNGLNLYVKSYMFRLALKSLRLQMAVISRRITDGNLNNIFSHLLTSLAPTNQFLISFQKLFTPFFCPSKQSIAQRVGKEWALS